MTLGPVIGETVSDDIEIDVTNEELAESMAIASSTTSRIMSEWEKIGVLSKLRGRAVNTLLADCSAIYPHRSQRKRRPHE